MNVETRRLQFPPTYLYVLGHVSLQVAGTVTLGIANIVGVAFLTALLGDYGARQVLLYNGLGWIASLLPAFGVSHGHQQCWRSASEDISCTL
jgi:hypothetical protein